MGAPIKKEPTLKNGNLIRPTFSLKRSSAVLSATLQIGLLGRVFTVFAGFLACASLSGCAGHSRYDEAWFTSGRLLYENRKENSNSYIVDATTDTLLAHAINNGPDHNPVYSDNPQNKSFHLKSLNLSTNDKLYLVYGINADNGNECPSPDNPFVVQFNNTNQSWMVLDSTTGSNILLASGQAATVETWRGLGCNVDHLPAPVGVWTDPCEPGDFLRITEYGPPGDDTIDLTSEVNAEGYFQFSYQDHKGNQPPILISIPTAGEPFLDVQNAIAQQVAKLSDSRKHVMVSIEHQKERYVNVTVGSSKPMELKWNANLDLSRLLLEIFGPLKPRSKDHLYIVYLTPYFAGSKLNSAQFVVSRYNGVYMPNHIWPGWVSVPVRPNDQIYIRSDRSLFRWWPSTRVPEYPYLNR